MARGDFHAPAELEALRMENELLAFEVRFLKAQLAGVQRANAEANVDARSYEERLRTIRSEKAELESRLAESERSRARLARVEKDIVLLLTRMRGSPLGWIFRLKKGFRTLERRYLLNAGDPHGDR